MPSRRHHYIPVFYLRQWAGDGAKVCQFSRPYDRVVPMRVHPSGTGYQDDLYTIGGVEENLQQWTEDVFLKQADQQANAALQYLLRGDADIPRPLRSGWSRFIMSLLSRTPERVNGFRKMFTEGLSNLADEISREYDANHQNDEVPPSPEQKVADIQRDNELGVAKVLQYAMNSPRVGSLLNNMRWSIFNIPNGRLTLLTSDRPVMLPHGLKDQNSLVMLPISPATLFAAANDQSTLDRIQETAPSDTTQRSNVAVTENAIKYVYGTDDYQVNFVEKHLRRA